MNYHEKPVHKLNVSDLNELYRHSRDIDEEIFAEQMSNINLIMGKHYSKSAESGLEYIRQLDNYDSDKKVRAVRNHIQSIVRYYRTGILANSPGVSIFANNDSELQDQKAAQISKSVWEYQKHNLNVNAMIRRWAHTFIGLGEVAAKVFWDPDKGDIKGYTKDEDGNQSPIFSGELAIENIAGYNLLRDPSCREWEEGAYVGLRKLVPTKKVKRLLPPEDRDRVSSGADTDSNYDYFAFSGNTGLYERLNDHTLVKEFYFRKCAEAPEGYYYIFTDTHKIEEGVLPYGRFPIVYAGCEPIEGSPRHHSIIRHARPYQMDINAAASKIAERRMYLGDYKVIVNSNSQYSEGLALPGIRLIKTNNNAPITTLEPKEVGSLIDEISSTAQQMYFALNLTDEFREMEKQNQNASDPYGQLFKSEKQRVKYSYYSDMFEDFQRQTCELALGLCRDYYESDKIVKMIGRNERVNIGEFKNQEPMRYQIRVEANTNDINSRFGKYLEIRDTLQYGGDVIKQDVGKFVRMMPLLSKEKIFEDLTIDYDSAENMILAIDRGEQFQPSQFDNHAYMLNKVTMRMRQSDFVMLPPEVQQHYQDVQRVYETLLSKQNQDQMAQNADMIPTGGGYVKVDMLEPTGDGDKMKKVIMYQNSLNWLRKRLEAQGHNEENLRAHVRDEETVKRILSSGQPPQQS